MNKNIIFSVIVGIIVGSAFIFVGYISFQAYQNTSKNTEAITTRQSSRIRS